MHPLLRYTLDLFEINEPVASVKRGHKATTFEATGAAASDASDVAMQGQAAGAPGSPFRHPRASRELRLGQTLIAYEFKRGKRRSIGFSVGVDGLAVRAPKWVTLADVDAAVQDKSAWILRKLQESRERHARLVAREIVWCDGADIPFLARQVTLRLDPEHRFCPAGAAQLVDGALSLGLPLAASSEQIRDAAQAWLMGEARALFCQRLDHFAPLLGVQWKKLSLSNAGTRWGSARLDGSIRLNWRLIHLQPSVIDYVVAHELSHLRVMDHSPRFWDTVRTVVPEYAALRKQLKEEASAA
jgi:predicted metal-dependent hydrolase